MNKFFEKLSNPLIFILVAAILRIVPHVPNFAPIGAMALFGGTYLKGRTAVILPIAAMVLSDIVVGFDNLSSRVVVYGAFIAIVLIGVWLKSHRNFKTIVSATLLSSLLFFVVTNFGVWAFGTIYPKTAAGLESCFIAAVPFFRNTILGDLFYTGVLFGSYEFVKSLAAQKELLKLKVGK